MAIIRISEADAARDFASLMARVSAGEQIVIERNSRPLATLQPAANLNVRLLSESLEIAKQRGFTSKPDEGYAEDVRAFVESRSEPLHSPWD